MIRNERVQRKAKSPYDTTNRPKRGVRKTLRQMLLDGEFDLEQKFFFIDHDEKHRGVVLNQQLYVVGDIVHTTGGISKIMSFVEPDHVNVQCLLNVLPPHTEFDGGQVVEGNLAVEEKVKCIKIDRIQSLWNYKSPFVTHVTHSYDGEKTCTKWSKEDEKKFRDEYIQTWHPSKFLVRNKDALVLFLGSNNDRKETKKSVGLAKRFKACYNQFLKDKKWTLEFIQLVQQKIKDAFLDYSNMNITDLEEWFYSTTRWVLSPHEVYMK